MNENIKKMIKETFLEIADSIEYKTHNKIVKIGLTILGSEHGIENMIEGARIAQKMNSGMKIVLIGPKNESEFETIEIDDEKEVHKKMEYLLDEKIIDACVTMHYNFPIGVSTVGRIITPSKGKEVIIATTTGTSSTNRIEAMIKNAIYGIIVAKGIGIKKPKIGITNVDGARQVEKALQDLKKNGYEIEFAESERADGGFIMRGNDILTGSADVMISDSLTGNLLIKILSAFTTGGSYESVGYGYGPGIGEAYNRKIFIVSRASGSSVVANSLRFAFESILGNIEKVSKEEFEKSHKFGLNDILAYINKDSKKEDLNHTKMPSKKIVTSTISGIDIMELEDVVKLLWKNDIYAESGMGCTGPILLISPEDTNIVIEILKKSNYSFNEGDIC